MKNVVADVVKDVKSKRHEQVTGGATKERKNTVKLVKVIKVGQSRRWRNGGSRGWSVVSVWW